MSFVGQQLFTRRRFTGGGIDPTTGRPDTVTAEDTPMAGTVNPIPGEELAVLPEGERTGEQIRIIALRGTLRGSDETTGVVADYIVWQGKTYQVRTVQDYVQVIPHIEVRAKRVEGG